MEQFYCNGKKGICKNKNCTNCKKYNGTGGNYIEVDENRNPTNFDRITESEQAFVKWVLDNYYSVPKFFPCETKCNGDCEECFIEWPQKEIEE